MLQQTTEQAHSFIPAFAKITKMQDGRFVPGELADGKTNTLSDEVSNSESVVRSQLEKCDPVGSDSSPQIVSGGATPLPESTAQADTPAQQSDDEIIQWLASLRPLEYDRVRKEKATALGVRPNTLDGMVKDARAGESEADRLPFPEVEPHPDPINPAQLLNEVSDTIRKFIVLDVEQAHAAALWVAFTWFIDDVKFAPLALITAPEKSCGKTNLLALFGRMVCRPLTASNMKSATLFRMAEKWHPAILIDEADTFIKIDEEISGLINAGHTRDSATAWRLVGDNYEPKSFNVWGAKALAGIALEKHLSDATMSRGIVFNLRRKLPNESVSRLRHATDDDLFEVIASKLARFEADYSQRMRLARPLLPRALSDRAQDNWEPLLAIAMCAGDEWVRRATAAAIKLSGSGDKKVSTGNELLADIQHIFKSKGVDKISTENLIAALVAEPEKSWATFNNGNPITPRQVAGLLKGYDGIASKTVRLGAHETPKGFELSQFYDAFARYLSTPLNLPQHPQQTLEANMHAGLAVAGVPPQISICHNAATPEAPPSLGCGAVADKAPIFGGTEASRPNASHLRI
jgi:putative DNA primase/helicase